MGNVLYYNTGSKEMEHLKRNIAMFRGLGVECRAFKYFPAGLLIRKCDYLYLNWYENIYKGFFPIALGMYCAKRFALFIARIRRIKVISSQHNRVQHDARYKTLSRAMLQAVYSHSDTIIVFSMEGKKDLKLFLSDEEIERKAVFIPPVNYIGSYPYVKHDWITRLGDPARFTVLFIGNMDRPYKNVEMAIDVAKELHEEPIRFLFAGKVSDAEQKKRYLTEIGDADNITAEFRFIQDDEMAQLLEIGDVVIAPYDVESISNSGTARLAFSYARTVICPEIPSLESVPKDLVYTYSYTDREDHREQLTKQIKKAYADFSEDADAFREKGKRLAIMEEENSPEAIAQKYKALFSRSGKTSSRS